MAKIVLSWSNDSNIHSHQKLYKSLTPFDQNTLPAGAVIIGRDVRSYEDSDVAEGFTYYYAVSTVGWDGGEYVSGVAEVEAVPVDGDPYWSNVAALLHFDGDLEDAKGGAWVASGSLMTWESAPPGFGSAIRFRGGNESITGPRLIFGSSDYTVELRIRLPDGPLPVGQVKYILTTSNSNYGHGMVIAVRSNTGDGNTYLYAQNGVGGSEINITSNTSISDDQYHHVALVRESGQVRLYLDGVEEGSTTGMMAEANSRAVRLGSDYNNSSRGYTGEIDELRITIGVARYTSNFTLPTKPFPNYGV